MASSVFISTLIISLAMCEVGISQTLTASSVFNDQPPGFATDADQDTCYMSGFQPVTWFKSITPTPQTVHSVQLTGSFHGRVRVQVGTETDPLGQRAGHEANPTCGAFEMEGDVINFRVDCENPLVGDVITVEVTNIVPGQMVLCDVILNE